jgi:tetratricopeptide (TPR) repeat protein
MRHEANVYSAVFSPGGTRVLTASRDNTARLWDLDGRCLGLVDLVVAGVQIVYSSHSASCLVGPNGRLAILQFGPTCVVVSAAQLDGPERQLVDDWGVGVGVGLGAEVEALMADGAAALDDKPAAPPVRRSAFDADIVASALAPDGSRRVSAHHDRSVRFVDTATQRELAVLRLNETPTDLKFTPDGTRLIVMLGEEKALVWDTRPPEARQADRDARRAERGPAETLVDALLAGPKPSAELAPAIRADQALPALHRLAALEVLRERMAPIHAEARKVFNELTREHITFARVRAAVEPLTGLPPRVAEALRGKAADWKPDLMQLNNTAWQAVLKPGASGARLAGAREFAEEAVRRAPEDGEMLALLGAAQYRAGMFEDALQTLGRSNKLSTGVRSSETAFIAMSHLRLGRRADAEALLLRLRELLRTGNRIEGGVAGRRLSFSFEVEDGNGEGWFELAENGQSFDGKRRWGRNASWSPWTGKRLSGAAPDRFDGLWSTSDGDMWLFSDGDRVRGYYGIESFVVEAVLLIEGPPATQPGAAAPQTQPGAAVPQTQPASNPSRAVLSPAEPA